jgi:adenylate cyclase
MPEQSGRPDRRAALERLEETLLGGPRAFTRVEVAERAGVPLERAEVLWRSLGFATVADDEVVFGQRDVDALRSITAVVDSGAVDREHEAAVARSLGQAMARLADWQAALLTDPAPGATEGATQDGDPTLDAVDGLVPVIEELQSYVWRRHLAAAAARVLPVADDELDADSVVVGFADIVGFTRLSRSVGEEELAELVERFESVTAATIAEHGGRVVKVIGDEVLFVVPRPESAAAVAVALHRWVEESPELPQLRVGMASGRVTSRLGDVLGPVVNVAARLTSVARPGSTVVDRELAAALGDTGPWTLRRIRRVSVRGYAHLEPWVLRASG